MKFKDSVGSQLLAAGCLILIVAGFLPALLIKLLMTPWDYIQYKRARYQQDFPHKYTWLRTPHADNAPYTAIKENGLPVEYIKWQEEYDASGYCVCGDVLLDFHEPFFFEADTGRWLFYQKEEDADESVDEENDEENADDCLTVDAARERILEELPHNIAGHDCRRVVFFCMRQNVEKKVEKKDRKVALETMRELNDVILYEKGELPEAIQAFIAAQGSPS